MAKSSIEIYVYKFQDQKRKKDLLLEIPVNAKTMEQFQASQDELESFEKVDRRGNTGIYSMAAWLGGRVHMSRALLSFKQAQHRDLERGIEGKTALFKASFTFHQAPYRELKPGLCIFTPYSISKYYKLCSFHLTHRRNFNLFL